MEPRELHTVSLMPGGAGDSELTSSLNEDCKGVRNLRTDIEDS